MARGRGRRHVGPGRSHTPLITRQLFPEIKNRGAVIGQQINVMGDYWQGRMSAAERATVYKCTVLSYDALHRPAGGGAPGAHWQLQEMGPSGTGSLEAGDASGELFFMPNNKFVRFYYETFPDLLPVPTQTQAEADVSAGGDDGAGTSRSSGRGCGGAIDRDDGPLNNAEFQEGGRRAGSNALLNQYWRLLSDDEAGDGPRRGQRAAIFECIISVDGKECGARRTIWHRSGMAPSNSNLHTHIAKYADKCAAHRAVSTELKEQSANMVLVNGEYVTKMKFGEAFPHHVRATWMRAAGIVSSNFFRKEQTHDYVRGYAARAVFPNNEIINRVASCIDELQEEERVSRFKRQAALFDNLPHIGLQLDMWTDRETKISHACITATTVMEPVLNTWSSKSPPQLYVQSEIIEFNEFPSTSKTGENIKDWFLSSLESGAIKQSTVSGITPDGAADGQCGLHMIHGLNEKVDTCHLHQLQRAVLYCIGLAGTTCANVDAKELLRKHGRIVQLVNQSNVVAKTIREGQLAAGLGLHQVRMPMRTATTRWGNQYLQLKINNLIKPILDPVVEAFKRKNRTDAEIFTEEDQSENGTRVTRSVAAAELGLSSSEWEASLQAEAFLRPFFETKEAIEHKSYMTGAQSMMIMQNHITKDCEAYSGIHILNFPATASFVDRERGQEYIPAAAINQIVITARAQAAEQLQKRFFHERPSNTRLVLAAMSKQRKMDRWLGAAQCRLANTLYLQYLRAAANILKVNNSKRLPTRTSPRKSATGDKRKLMDDSDSDNDLAMGRGAASDTTTTEDSVVIEVRKWKDIQKETIDKYKDDQGIVNEFWLLWDLKDSFPLHFIIFKQCASHLSHEANVEQIFSLAGKLADPNLYGENLTRFTRIHFNRRAYCPPQDAILTRYLRLRKYCIAGQRVDMLDENGQPISSVA